MTQDRIHVPATGTAVAGMLLALLAAAGCMTGRERVASPSPGNGATERYATIAPANSECEAFFCER